MDCLWASLRRGFLLWWWPCKPTCCSVWRMVWALTSWPSASAISKAMLAALMRLFFEASFCTWLSTRTQHLWSTLVRPVLSETRLGKPLSLATVLSGCYRVSYSLTHILGGNNSNSQILREFFAMRCHVEHPVASMRELYSNNQIWTALKQDTQIYIVLSSRKNMNMMNKTCGFAWLNDV